MGPDIFSPDSGNTICKENKEQSKWTRTSEVCLTIFSADYRDIICNEILNSAYGLGLRRLIRKYLFRALGTNVHTD
jgi:hypothetical protein